MDRAKALSALERMGRIVAAMRETEPNMAVKYERKLQSSEVLYKKGDVTITEGDVDDAIEMARQRVGDEFASLLVAPAYVEK